MFASAASFVARVGAAMLMASLASVAAAQGTGEIELSMIPSAGAARIDGPVKWEVMNYSRDPQGLRWVIAEGVGAVRTFTLPAGTYSVRANYSGIVANHTVDVKSGTKYNYVLNLYASWVRLVAVGKESGRPFQETVNWQVYRAADLEKGGTPVAVVSEAQPRLLLREGSYVIRARQSTFSGEATVTVEPGGSREIQVHMAGPNA